MTDEVVIKGMRFSLTDAELRQLIVEQAGRLRTWIEDQGLSLNDAESYKLRFRRGLLAMLEYGADHLEHGMIYELDRQEVMSLFESWED